MSVAFWARFVREEWMLVASVVLLLLGFGYLIAAGQAAMEPCREGLRQALAAERWEEARAWAAALEAGVCPRA